MIIEELVKKELLDDDFCSYLSMELVSLISHLSNLYILIYYTIYDKTY